MESQPEIIILKFYFKIIISVNLKFEVVQFFQIFNLIFFINVTNFLFKN